MSTEWHSLRNGIAVPMHQVPSFPFSDLRQAIIAAPLRNRRVAALFGRPMGQAIAYTLNQWEALCVYTRDGELNIDNNVSERNLRRLATGRNNWTFLKHR